MVDLPIPPGDGVLSQTEKNVLDVIGRESARIRALPVADMQINIGNSSAPSATFEQQVAEATFVFEDQLQPGKIVSTAYREKH